jgi:hypothetical protein
LPRLGHRPLPPSRPVDQDAAAQLMRLRSVLEP